MKAVLRDTKTDKIIVELLDNINYELSEEEIENFIEELELTPKDIDNMYIDYI